MGPVFTPNQRNVSQNKRYIRDKKNATCESALYYLWMELNGNNKPGSLFSKVHYKMSALCFSFVSHSFLKLKYIKYRR